MESMAEVQFEACRDRRLLDVGSHVRLGQLSILISVHHRVVPFVSADLIRLSLHTRDILHSNVSAASHRLHLHVLRLALLVHLTQSLLHLTLHLILEVLNVLRHLSVLRHELVLLGQLRQVLVLQLIRHLVRQIVLLLAEDRSRRMLRYVRYQPVQLGERLVARVAVVVVLPFQLAERSAAALLRTVQRVRRGGAGRWEDR